MKRTRDRGKFASEAIVLPPPSSDPIKIRKPSLDDEVMEGNPCLRGVIRPESIASLRIDSHYQRELLSLSTRRFILRAISSGGRLPDIELGMRGQRWEFDDDDVVLLDPVFVIDGQQRRGTVLEYLTINPDFDPHLGVIIHFGTTMEWERNRFQLLGAHRTNISGAIIIRNMRSTCPGVATLYGLTQTDESFALYNRVGWGQTMLTKDLLSAQTYMRAILNMHGHLGGGITTNQSALVEGAVNKLVRIIGLPTLRNNTKTLFNFIDKIWGIQELETRGATWLRSTFILALTDVISNHTDFWTYQDRELKFSPTIHEKFESFPINDPQIRMLAATSGAARPQLTYHMIQHINKGRRTHLEQRDLEAISRSHHVAAQRSRLNLDEIFQP